MRSILFALQCGLRDTSRVAGRAVALALYVGVLGFLAGSSAGLVSQSLADIAATGRLATLDAAYFVEGGSSAASTPGQVRALVTRTLAAGDAYTLRVETGSTGTSPAGAEQVVHVWGDFAEAFGIDLTSHTGRYALVGTQLGVEPGTSISVDTEYLPVAGVMSGVGFVDLWTQFRPLDRSIVVVEDLASLAGASDAEISELASRMVLLHATGERIGSYLSASQESLSLMPRLAGDKIANDITQEKSGRVWFLIVFGAGLLTTIVALTSTIASLIRGRRREYAVSGVLGATFAVVAARLTVFVGLVWVLPALVSSSVGVWLAGNGSLAIGWWLWSAIAALGLLVAGWFAWHVVRSDATAELRA